MNLRHLYLLAIFYAGVAYFVTRGKDGELRLCFILFGCLGMIYVGLFTSLARTRWSAHSLGHFMAFSGAALGASLIDSHLDGMAGMLFLIIPFVIAVTIILAVFVNVIIWK